MSKIQLVVDDVLFFHEEMERTSRMEKGVRDMGLLASAVNAPFQSFGGVELYPTLTEKAARLCYGIAKNHPFFDGNKRTAIIAANYQMIAAGAGIINIAQAQLERWHALLSAFYESGDDGEIVRWTYEHCVHGIEMQP